MNSRAAIKSQLPRLLGLHAPQAYRELLLNWMEVEAIDIFEYENPPRMQDRIAIHEAERGLIERANAMRLGTGVPFWEALFATCAVTGECTDSIVAAAFFHNGQGMQRCISRDQIREGVLEHAIKSANRVVAMGSRVLGKEGLIGHLNFLDFHCPVSEQNLELVRRVCRQLMASGFVLLDSGGSYHACSVSIVSDEERMRTLASAILVSPVVDARYVAHQLLQDSSSLRISSGGSLDKIPVVVDAWIPENSEQ